MQYELIPITDLMHSLLLDARFRRPNEVPLIAVMQHDCLRARSSRGLRALPR